MLGILGGMVLCLLLFTVYFYTTTFSFSIWESAPVRQIALIIISLLGAFITFLLADLKFGLIMLPISAIVGFLGNKLAMRISRYEASKLIGKLLVVVLGNTDTETPNDLIQSARKFLLDKSINQLIWARLYIDAEINSPAIFNPEVTILARAAINEEISMRGLPVPPE